MKYSIIHWQQNNQLNLVDAADAINSKQDEDSGDVEEEDGAHVDEDVVGQLGGVVEEVQSGDDVTARAVQGEHGQCGVIESAQSLISIEVMSIEKYSC